METPRLGALGEYELVAVECGYFDPYVVEGLETEGLFNHDGVGLFALFRVALDEEAVAYMLEIAEHLSLCQTAESCHRARKADVEVLRHLPLS